MGEGRLQAFLPRAEVGVSLFCHEQNKRVRKISLAQTLTSTLASLFNPWQDLIRSCLLALGCLLLTFSRNTVGRMLGQLFEDLREAAEPWLSRQSASTSFSPVEILPGFPTLSSFPHKCTLRLSQYCWRLQRGRENMKFT